MDVAEAELRLYKINKCTFPLQIIIITVIIPIRWWSEEEERATGLNRIGTDAWLYEMWSKWGLFNFKPDSLEEGWFKNLVCVGGD